MKRKFVTPFKNPPPKAAEPTQQEASKSTVVASSADKKDVSITSQSNTSQDTPKSTTTTISATTTKKKFVPPTRTKPSSETPTSNNNTNPKSNNNNNNSNGSSNSGSTNNDEDEGEVWMVMHTKNSNKKHKTFDDGFMLIRNKKYTLFDSQGKQLIAKSFSKIETFRENDQLTLGTKLVDFQSKLKMEDYISGRIFLQYQSNITTPKVNTISTAAKTEFKRHTTAKTAGLGYNNNEIQVIKAPEGAYILNENHPEKDKNGKKLSDVFVDNFLGENLRPHQVEGVKFMYECVMGLKDFVGKGCLLADEMGLGKTLQTITLIYTLLRRGPLGSPILKKAIVVTNSSLVKNWTSEFDKWVGEDKIKVLTVTTKTAKQSPSETLKIFKAGYHQVLIISYNLCTNYVEELQDCQCDILICDEGHKLKNANIKIFQTLKKISTPRRIVLSGTPLQNDLNEFFTICDFINPGLLGDATSFKNLFTEPIKKSQEPNAKKQDKVIGETRSKELNKIVSQFVLRRTNLLLRQHLPPKMEIVLFCGMSELQENLYKHFVLSKTLRGVINGTLDSNNALACIMHLKKLLAHPNMIYPQEKNEKDEEEDNELFDDIWSQSKKLFPSGYDPNDKEEYHSEYSGKLLVLDNLLKEIRQVGDRVVIVSNFKSILNEIEKLCNIRDYPLSRLDGSTQSEKRMGIVNSFNSPKSDDFIFLLSSKAGGCGLNLIGANRLIMIDPDWNPSNDEQAMARVWRDGQKKNVFIYRMIGCGSIEEKIFQRQIVKTGLSKSTLDEKSLKSQFSSEMLKELFKYESDMDCKTYPAESNDIETIKEKDEILAKVLEEEDVKIPFVKITLDTEDGTKNQSNDTNNEEAEEEETNEEEESSEEDSLESDSKKRKIDPEEGEEEFKFIDEEDEE